MSLCHAGHIQIARFRAGDNEDRSVVGWRKRPGTILRGVDGRNGLECGKGNRKRLEHESR